MSQDNEQLEDAMNREGFGGGVVDDEPEQRYPEARYICNHPVDWGHEYCPRESCGCSIGFEEHKRLLAEALARGIVDDEPEDTKDLALEEIIRSGDPISMHTILAIASIEEILFELRRRGFDRITLSTCSD